MSKVILLLPVVALCAGCTSIATNGNDTSFERLGVASCTTATTVTTGTAADPVRCGPQAQQIN